MEEGIAGTTNSSSLGRALRSKTLVFAWSWIAGYFALTLLYRTAAQEQLALAFAISTTATQTLLDLFIVFAAAMLLAKKFENKALKRIFISGFVCAAVADLIYGLAVNVLGYTDTRGTWIEISYNLPFNLFLTLMAYFFLSRTGKVSATANQRIRLAAVGVFFVLAYLYVSPQTIKDTPLQTLIITTWSLAAEATLIVGALIFFLFGTNHPSQLISGGILIICFVNLLLQFLEFSGKLGPGLPFEAFWVLGQATCLLGLVTAASDSIGSKRMLDFKFENTRAKFVLSLVALVAALHACWHLFFISFGAEQSGIVEFFLFIIFLSLTLAPLTLILKTYLIKPVLHILERIHRSHGEALPIPNIDEDLQNMGAQVVERIVSAEREMIQNRGMAQLAAQVSHDIQAPLSTLLSVVRNSSKLPQERQTTVIQSVVLRIEQITADLLRRYRSDAQRRFTATTFVEPVLRAICDEKLISLRDSQTSLDLQVTETAKGACLRLPAMVLGRIVSNLVDNSIHAINRYPSPGNIYVKADKMSPGNILQISISDNGPGMCPEIREKIMTVGGSYKSLNGLGLGLSYVRSTTEQYGGKMTVTSDPGLGTSVILLFESIETADIDILEASEVKRESEQPVPDLVLIDDDEMVRQTWTLEAEIHSLKLLTAGTPNALDWDLVPSHIPIFMDLHLAEMDGIAALKALRTQGFKKLYLSTGAQPPEIPDFIIDVVGKEFPIHLANRE